MTWSPVFAPNGKTLASASSDTTILIWNIADLRLPAADRTLTEQELEICWNALAGTDAVKAYQAIGKLANANSAAEFIGKRLLPVAPLDSKQVAQWLADLDSDEFVVRERAATDLAKFGELAVPAMQEALKKKPPLEKRRTLEALLATHGSPVVTAPEQLRGLRAIEALEYLGSADAKKVLAKIATGVPEARMTKEAKASLERLAKRL